MRKRDHSNDFPVQRMDSPGEEFNTEAHKKGSWISSKLLCKLVEYIMCPMENRIFILGGTDRGTLKKEV